MVHSISGIKQNRGLTIINLLIVSVIISVIAIGIISIAKQDVEDAKLSSSTFMVAVLHEATKRYYDSHCKDASFVQPTISLLVSQGFLGNQNLTDIPYVNSRSIAIVNVGMPSVLFRYAYQFIDSNTALRASEGQANASVSGSTVTWSYTNNAIGEDSLSYNYEVLNTFGVNVCN